MKILAVASAGGHWTELLRLMPAFETEKIVFISTKASFAETVGKYKFYSVPDANKRTKFKLIIMGLKVGYLVFKEKPKMVITTGAAPGLMGIIAGRIVGAKTIWIDSIANVEKISLSGRLAVYFAHKVYTQWQNLANSKIIFKGNIL